MNGFRPPGIGGTNVGIYKDGEFETTEYEDGAAIAAVWVSCVSGTDCPADRVADCALVDGSDAGSGDSDLLPMTGTSELVLMSLVSVLFVIGGALVMVERRYESPAGFTVISDSETADYSKSLLDRRIFILHV